ncbi:MAG TPA: rhomboid family intramembrane serine protease, partial [Candidatus Obscuribacterales bacterium]
MIPLRDNLRCTVFPIATLVLIGLNCAAFFVELMVAGSGNLDSFFMKWTMIPAKVVAAFASGDPSLIGMAVASIFTSMFLHGGWMHIIGNMLFLNCFGRGMEARLGRVRFVLFYLLSGLAASAIHIWSDPTSTIPTLGASGAIAGVLGGYLLLWPLAEVRGIFLLVFIPIPIHLRAYWFLLAWFIVQVYEVINSIGQVVAGGGVAYWAHAGGFVAGLVLAGLWKLYRPESDVCYI